MRGEPSSQQQVGPHAREFYSRALEALSAGPPFLIGGAFAFESYTGIKRHTKDLDLFVRPGDRDAALAVLASAGYRTELSYPHWLVKAFCGEDFIDVIYNLGNGLAPFDESWFEHAVPGELFGQPVLFCAAEEMIWSKAFTMERERYDGADIAHLLCACARRLDWQRLLRRFDRYWRVLLSHLVLFGFIYPGERSAIPNDVLNELLRRLQEEMASAPPDDRLCQGTLLAGAQYLPDIEEWGQHDARLKPWGALTPEQIAQWRATVPAHNIPEVSSPRDENRPSPESAGPFPEGGRPASEPCPGVSRR
jgi:hypothetical protein